MVEEEQRVTLMLHVKGNLEKHTVWSVLSLDHSVRPQSQINAILISDNLFLTD